jgi:hypothetical protein
MFEVKLLIFIYFMLVVTVASLLQHMTGSYANSNIIEQNTAVPVLTRECTQALLQLPVDASVDTAAMTS